MIVVGCSNIRVFVCVNIKYLKSSAALLIERCNESQMHLVPIQSGDVNRENTFSNRNRIHPKYVCTRTRENSRSSPPALRYSIPIAFVGFPTYPHASSSLSAFNSLSLLVSLFFSLHLCSLYIYRERGGIHDIYIYMYRHARIFTYSHERLSGRAYPLGWSKVYCPCGLKSPCENFARSPLPNPPLNWT